MFLKTSGSGSAKWGRTNDLVSKKADDKNTQTKTALALKRRSYLRDYSDPMQ